MANLLADSLNWSESNLTSPPPSMWTGSEYNLARDEFQSGAVLLVFQGTPVSGDTFSGTLAISSELNGYWFSLIDSGSDTDYNTVYYKLQLVTGDNNISTEALSSTQFMLSSFDPDGETTVDDVAGPFTFSLDPSGSPIPFIRSKNYVYELEKGWSFDGNYIPHFVELNWYFGDDPLTYKGTQKLRIHGLSKGYSLLQVAVNGMQTDYLEDYTEAQFIDLPYNPYMITDDLIAVTNYTDLADLGLSVQFKFSGRNTDITLPEPPHVIQVLVLQDQPAGSGRRAN